MLGRQAGREAGVHIDEGTELGIMIRGRNLPEVVLDCLANLVVYAQNRSHEGAHRVAQGVCEGKGVGVLVDVVGAQHTLEHTQHAVHILPAPTRHSQGVVECKWCCISAELAGCARPLPICP